MKRAFRNFLLAGAAAVALVTAPKPADAIFGMGDLVFDPIMNSLQIEQFAKQLEQAAVELQQLEQTVETYVHMVQNATRLQNLPQILDTLGLDTGQLTSGMSALKAINSLYSIGNTGEQFASDARRLLNTNGYVVPSLDMNTFRSLAGGLYRPEDATTAANGYNRQVKDTDQYIQSAGVLADVNTQRANLASSLNDQLQAAAGLGDTSQGATLQSILALQGTAARQNDLLVRTTTVAADAALQERLARIQAETAIAEGDLANVRARQDYANASINDVTNLAWTAQ